MTHDVFVIGGGPVGLAAAIAARRKGFRVVLCDALEPPIDKACGEGVPPDGVAAAKSLGVDLRSVVSHTIRGIRISGDGVSLIADFPNETGLGIRRTTLHSALVRAAEECGVELRWRCCVSERTQIDAEWIIGADGMGSRARKWAGLNASVRDSRRYGFRIRYGLRPWSDYVEVHGTDGCQIYITPISQDETSVALLSRDQKQRLDDALQLFPEVAERLRGAEATCRERGAITASRRLRRVTRGNIALIGDASGSVDAISGEGLSLGFQQALALADAMAKRDLSLYESVHRRLARRPRLMAGLMLTLDRWPSLRRRALPVLARHPGVFRKLLAVHVGTDDCLSGYARSLICD